MKEIQSEINIGVIGHVDHGKTSLTSIITGVWTDKYSEEVKQGISIKLGYADASFYKCKKCSGIQAYGSTETCKFCGSKCELIKKVSFVDAPGHETLMAVMLSGATLFNGAILVIGANEDCPQPRTIEHFLSLKIHGIKNVVVAQNKIDLVTKEEALENYKKIRKFLDDEGYSHVPIIPTSAHFNTNIDALIYALLKYIPTPEKDKKGNLVMRVVRSFDANKPNTDIKELKGGVLGGTILSGSLKVGDEVLLYPGIKKPMKLTVKSLNCGNLCFKSVCSGGLVAVGTDIDPKFVSGDKMVGQIICDEKSKPNISKSLSLNYYKIDRLTDANKTELKVGEKLVLIIGTAAYLGIIKKLNKNKLEIYSDKEIIYYDSDKIAISRLVNNRWRLSGYAQTK